MMNKKNIHKRENSTLEKALCLAVYIEKDLSELII